MICSAFWKSYTFMAIAHSSRNLTVSAIRLRSNSISVPQRRHSSRHDWVAPHVGQRQTSVSLSFSFTVFSSKKCYYPVKSKIVDVFPAYFAWFFAHFVVKILPQGTQRTQRNAQNCVWQGTMPGLLHFLSELGFVGLEDCRIFCRNYSAEFF